jgi:response regulator RpfG family c-di-GMP phosphodiesterase
MPKMSGFELYKKLKKLDDKPKVCFVTAFEIYYDEFRRVFPNLHVKCFVRKPISTKDLINQVRNEIYSPPAPEGQR